jgi:diguanylate cyclase (GGDEF)-like protein
MSGSAATRRNRRAPSAGEAKGGAGPAAAANGASALAAREARILARERALLAREQDLAACQVALRERADRAADRELHAARTTAQLQEANERLVIATVRAQTLAEAAEKIAARISHMAKHDVLTNLPNRLLLTDRLSQAIALAQRHGRQLAVLYLDLDQFKRINDSLGHAVGDLLLQSVARRLLACVRGSDTVCRQGGDEFVVLLAEVATVGDAALTAQKLITALARPHRIAGHRLHVTVSIGMSFYPDDGTDAEMLIKNADTAMYYAKRNGRNACDAFRAEMNDRAVARQSIEAALHQALERKEFVLNYQPKVDLKSGAITGAEALLRLSGPDQVLLRPDQFVGVAEDCGLIVPIGKWVLREACRQTAAWLGAGLDVGQIAVNVSAAEFHRGGFLADVRAILADTGLDPHHLALEVTESGLMQAAESTMSILAALRDLGVQIAVDDFGTGYSSLSYLHRFPVDILKVDQSFVQDIETAGEESILVGAIIEMGKNLKLRVVAEGIETQQQLSFLQSHDCAEGQGYLFSRPIPADEFAQLVAARKNFGDRPATSRLS